VISIPKILGLAVFGVVQPGSSDLSPTRVCLETSHGNIILELDSTAAPKTVDNFIGYVKDGFYDHTIFHRVIENFMIQGGGYTEGMDRKSTRDSIMNEADNGIKNRRGTIAMARTMDPHSASAQFFINSKDNDFLDHTGKTPEGWGYCVFGRVVEGMDVVDAIEKVPTTHRAGHQDVPSSPVTIKQATVVE
jgi:peptidyl-prolyl cis-trans isomerase B (cyclophilin B)